MRTIGALGVAVGGVLLVAGPAGAHITPDKDEVAADSFADVTLTVPHGCEESPTRELVVEIPESIVSVTPAVHPGWTISTQMEALPEPIQGEGEEITERVATVTFTAQAGNELQPSFRDSFTLGFRAPDAEGEHLFFKTIQRCVEGETPWIEEYTGEGEEPEHPAPVLLVTAAEQEGAEAEAPEEAAPEEEEDAEDAAEDVAEAEDEDDDDSSSALAIVGVVLGALGLVTGGFALYRTQTRA